MLRHKTMTHRTTWQAVLTLFSLLLAALVLFGPLAGTAQAGQNKVAVCHLNGDGNYIPISIADPALPNHLAHGDLVVGVDMDENCQPLVADTDSDGVPDAEDNCADLANPGQEDRYGTAAGDACEDLDSDGTLDVDEADFCLSINGVLLESRGTAECYSTTTTGNQANVAVANGDEALATAGADFGNFPLPGDNNRATAIGDMALALAGQGDNNNALSNGLQAESIAAEGNNNSATAIGNEALAHAAVGDNNSAWALGRAIAQAIFGNNNSASAEGDNAQAYATNGDNNSATSTGIYTCAGNGDSDETAVNEDLCSN